MRKYAGFIFVILLFISAAIVSLPADNASAYKLSSFYGKHGGIIIFTQLIGIVAATFLIYFSRLLKTYTNRQLAIAIAIVAIAGTLPAYPIIAMVVMHNSGDILATLNHISTQADNILFLVITYFAFVAFRSYRFLTRYFAFAVMFLCLARSIFGFAGNEALNAVAPISFLLLVLLMNIHLVRDKKLEAAKLVH